MTFRKLAAEEVTFTVGFEPEDMPVRCNVMASGDDVLDKEAEDEIIARLDRDDYLAWCCVKVTATWKEWSGVVYLGCCSFDSEEDFTKLNSDYYDDLKETALEDLNRELVAAESKAKQTLQTVVIDRACER